MSSYEWLLGQPVIIDNATAGLGEWLLGQPHYISNNKLKISFKLLKINNLLVNIKENRGGL